MKVDGFVFALWLLKLSLPLKSICLKDETICFMKDIPVESRSDALLMRNLQRDISVERLYCESAGLGGLCFWGGKERRGKEKWNGWRWGWTRWVGW